jgi:DNA helicase-2/ATP-dependent DNA helicase PcrA
MTLSDFYGTGKRAKKISPFIAEAIPNIGTTKQNLVKQLSLGDALSAYTKTKPAEPQSQPYKVSYITFSDLQAFDICPLHYKAKVIYKVPTPATSVQSFGISIHAALYDFYKQIQEGLKPNQKNLIDYLQEDWINEGYVNKKHEEESYKTARKLLTQYYKSKSKNLIKPIALEYQFRFLLKNGVKVFGKIDRIDTKENGIEIIDYKTGQDNPKAAKSHELQLSIYALAASRVNDKILNRNPENITLTLQFLGDGAKKTMSFKKEDLNKLESDLIEKIKEIESSDFKCSRSVLCVNCENRMLCNTIS